MPLSGKTETLKALLPNLHGKGGAELVFSPLAARGRTLYFDWAEYRGGTFRDGPLHCQIISVPGQASLHRRRRLLIEGADVVVFVVDSQRDQMEANRRSLTELKPWLERGEQPPIEIVYQANKRDLPDTLEVAEIRAALGLDGETEVYETSAVHGDGLRICFVAAVRSCVRRAEGLHASKKLPERTPEIATGEQLLERVRSADAADSANGAATADGADHGEAPATDAQPVFPPAASQPLASGPAATARPAVMPMADWLARKQSATERAAAAPATPELPPARALALATAATSSAATTPALPAIPVTMPATRTTQPAPAVAAISNISASSISSALSASSALSDLSASPTLSASPAISTIPAISAVPGAGENAPGTAWRTSRPRPAVMPMTAWIASTRHGGNPGDGDADSPGAKRAESNRAAEGAESNRAVEGADSNRAARQAASDNAAPHGLAQPRAAAAQASGQAAAGHRAAWPALVPSGLPPESSHRPAIMPMADFPSSSPAKTARAAVPPVRDTRPVPVLSPAALVAAAAAAAAVVAPMANPVRAASLPSSVPAKPPAAAALQTAPPAAREAGPAPIAVVAAAHPAAPPAAVTAPWLPDRESALIEAYPLTTWRKVLRAGDPKLAPPVEVAGTLQGRAGAGWHARAWGVLDTLDAGRDEFNRLIGWLMRLGNAVSSQRCVVLSGGGGRWYVWQIVHEELTLDLVMQQALEHELTSREAVQILSRAATDFVAAAQEFSHRSVELPIHLDTLAHENGATVYSGFLPQNPVAASRRDPLIELASELRSFNHANRLGSLNVTEALRELEHLSERRPQIVSTVEVLQSLLIGE
jgi:GTPase SAR1 family protein